MMGPEGIKGPMPPQPSPEFAGMGNPILAHTPSSVPSPVARYSPMAGRADRLQANIVGGGAGSLAQGGITASGTNIL